MLALPQPTSAYVVALALGLEAEAALWTQKVQADQQARQQIWPLLQDQLATRKDCSGQEVLLRQRLRRLEANQALARERAVVLQREISSLDRRLVGLRKNLAETVEEADKIKLRREGAKLSLLNQEKQREQTKLQEKAVQQLQLQQTLQSQASQLHQQSWTIQQQLGRFQAYLLSPQQWLECIGTRLQQLACGLFLQQDQQTFGQGLLQLAEQLQLRYQEIDQGLLSTKGMGALRTGKFFIAGEVALGLVGIGAYEPAQELLAVLQQNHSEQVWLDVPPLLRLFAVQTILGKQREQLDLLVQKYQYYPGLDGHMLLVCRAISENNVALAHQALVRLAHDGFAHWQQGAYPGLGVIQMSVLAAVRCVQLAGMQPPYLGSTVPWQLWN